MTVASLALISAACSSAQSDRTETGGAASPAPPPSATTPPKPITPVVKPAPKVKQTPPPPAATSAPTVAAPPISVIGLSRGDVEAVLGQPATRGNNGAGQNWTYTTDICQLQLFFFLDVQRNDFFALDQKIGGTDGTDAGTQRCLKRIADAKPR